MAKRRRRRQRRLPRIPEVFLRAYGSHVNTLERTILSLLPIPPPDSPLDCSCNGRLCLGCIGKSHLICDESPSEYLRFLTNSFCFVSLSAPPPPLNFLASGSDLSHIRGFFADRAFNSSSHIWNLLLERIGDDLMTFLLCHSSLFVPLGRHNYLQVTGNLRKDTVFKSLKVVNTGDFYPSPMLKTQANNSVLREKNENHALESSHDATSENSTTLLQFRKRKREFSWKRRKKHQKIASCLDCIVWHSTNKPKLGISIERKFMFYARHSSHSIFPRPHLLNYLKPTNSGAISLLNHIFGVSASDNLSNVVCSGPKSMPIVICSCFKASMSKCLFHSLVGLLKVLIRNSQRCQYKKLLWRHCLNPVFNRKNVNCGVSEFEHNLIDSYSSHNQVVSFVWAVTRSLVPKELLGDHIAWRALRKNISKFVRLRRFEKCLLKQCMYKLKSSHFPFLSKIALYGCSCSEFWKKDTNNVKTKQHLRALRDKNLSLQNKLFRCWIHWYFSYVVVPLLGNNFYVTERETRKVDVFYYPKPFWNKLYKKTVTQLKSTNYSVLDNVSLNKILWKRRISLGRSSFGFSKVRFLPKEKNVRPIANLKAPSKYSYTGKRNVGVCVKAAKNQSEVAWYKSVNSALRELYVVFKSIKADNPNKLGASVFDYNEIYQKLYQFVIRVRNASTVFPKLYIVVADVAKAYDSINQDLLIGIMNNVIPHDTYFFRNYSRIFCTKKSIKAMPCRLCSYHCNGKQDIMQIEASVQLNSSCCVFVDTGTGVEVSSDILQNVLAEHLKHNILQIGPDYYLQEVGISQGSAVSSLLCSFYYGHLEKSVILPFLEKAYEINAKTEKRELYYQSNECSGSELPENMLSHCVGDGNRCMNENLAGSNLNRFKIDKPQNLLMRFADDFLFLSTSKHQAATFFSRMQRGFRAFNCYMNFDKFGLNFDVQEPLLIQRSYTGEDGMQFIPWSGLLINSQRFEIQADYTRYLGIHVSSTITVQACAKPGRTLKKKLCDYIRPKCHPLLYDSNINSLKTVALNAYQAFLLCAMKFHCSVRSMPSINKLNPSYILGKLLLTFRFMYKLLKKRMRNMENGCSNIKPILRLKKKEISWLGLHAFLRVLKKKQSRYRDLIHLLRCKIAEKISPRPQLLYAIHDSHSSLFWKIRF